MTSKYTVNDVNDYLHKNKGKLYYKGEILCPTFTYETNEKSFYCSCLCNETEDRFTTSYKLHKIITIADYITHDKEGKIPFDPEYVEWVPKFNVGDIVVIGDHEVRMIRSIVYHDKLYSLGSRGFFTESRLALVCKAENREDLR